MLWYFLKFTNVLWELSSLDIEEAYKTLIPACRVLISQESPFSFTVHAANSSFICCLLHYSEYHFTSLNTSIFGISHEIRNLDNPAQSILCLSILLYFVSEWRN